jgi:hypothetical protein
VFRPRLFSDHPTKAVIPLPGNAKTSYIAAQRLITAVMLWNGESGSFNICRFAYSGWLNGAAFESALVGIKLMYDTSATWQRLPARACDVDGL